MWRSSRIAAVMGLAVSLVVFTGAASSRAADQPPEKGGRTYSLGMPSLYKPYVGFELQGYRPGDQGDLGGLLNGGNWPRGLRGLPGPGLRWRRQGHVLDPELPVRGRRRLQHHR